MIKKSWWVDLRINHTRYRKRSPENTRTGALAYEAYLRQKLARGESIDKPEGTVQAAQTFEQFAWKWFEEYVVPNNKQQEQRMKTYILRSALIPFFGKMSIEKITTRDVERYKAEALKKVSPKTVNNRLAVFGKCVRTAYEWLELSGIPPNIQMLKCPPAKTELLSQEECELLFANMEGVVREMLLMALRTGMRQGEIRALQWSSIDWRNRIITVRHNLNDRTHLLESPKNNRERPVPMDSDVYEILFRRKKATGFVFLDVDGKPFDSQRILRRLHKVREKVGLRKFGWHAFRHTVGTLAMDNGANLHDTQHLLGHSDIKTTMRYVHVRLSGLRATVALLNPRTAIGSEFGQPVGNQWIETIQRETKNA